MDYDQSQCYEQQSCSPHVAHDWVSIQLEQGQGQSHHHAHSFFIMYPVAGQIQGYQALATLQLLDITDSLKLVTCKQYSMWHSLLY